MQLRERGFMQSDCIMGDIGGGYIFGRVLKPDTDLLPGAQLSLSWK